MNIYFYLYFAYVNFELKLLEISINYANYREFYPFPNDVSTSLIALIFKPLFYF